MEELNLFYEIIPVNTQDLELVLRCLVQVVLLASSAVFSG